MLVRAGLQPLACSILCSITGSVGGEGHDDGPRGTAGVDGDACAVPGPAAGGGVPAGVGAAGGAVPGGAGPAARRGAGGVEGGPALPRRGRPTLGGGTTGTGPLAPGHRPSRRRRPVDHRRGHRLCPDSRPGGVLAVDPDDVAGWLGQLPVDALHGIGPRQAKVLREYGIHFVGLLAATPTATVQRLLGGRDGRTAADRARGIDPRPVVPPRPARHRGRPPRLQPAHPGRRPRPRHPARAGHRLRAAAAPA
ncbi:hypothetical protein [Streptomyces sp. NPDC006668]|uniref:hypothetical protein n=1 Tax=Streptomyces sp. NPDC006668 TaxID=3156903 RepID=UPI00340DD6FC